ncbi:MAG TPA: hypothetical protein VKH34_10770 [Vicinamibacterales bacterium]|nr:hypothetical protein [Vicinamibacterales bacterium]
MIRTIRLGRGVLAAVLLAAAWGAVTIAQAPKPAPKPAPDAKKNPLLRLIEPWPSPEEMKQRKADAESLPLFNGTEPLALTLATDFKALNKDRNPESTRRFPGELRMIGDNGTPVKLPVQVSARGHVRRMARTCDYVPIRVEFAKGTTKGTIFAKQEALKLVVQCVRGGDYEQYIFKEYLAYRMFNVVTHRSFRARLARVTYLDQATEQPNGTRIAMFVEDDTDVAKRMEGRTVTLERLLFKDVDTDTLMPAMIYEYMIGNTDFSIYALHNVKLVLRPDKSIHPVPYDFDFSGLVSPPYAAPDRNLMLNSVRDRMYRGPCKPQPQIDPYIANFVAKRDLIRALADEIPGMTKSSKDDARSYLDSFYSSIKTTRDVRRLFVDCKDISTM